MLYFLQEASENDGEEFENAIWKFIENKTYRNHVHKNIFRISNKEPNPDKINKLKKTIEALAETQRIDVPLLWFKVKENLKENLKETGETCLKWDRVKEIAEAEGLKEEKTLQEAVQFFHRVGDLVYFSDVGDFVVIDPQWLINMLSKVITIPGYREQQGGHCDASHWPKLEREGILHEDICKAVWPQGTVDGLIAIMMKYALLMPLSTNSDESKHKEYLVPSLLPPKPHGAGKGEEKRSNKREFLPVRLAAPENFIPVGLTSRLIAALTKKDHWVNQGQKYNNAAKFVVKKYGKKPQISINQIDGTIEISCTKRWEESSKLLQESVNLISSTLKVLSSSQDFKMQIYCDECRSWFPIKQFSEITETDDCPKCEREFNQTCYSIWVSNSEVSVDVFFSCVFYM